MEGSTNGNRCADTVSIQCPRTHLVMSHRASSLLSGETEISVHFALKFQTDRLGARFEKCRQVAGLRCHISVRQVFECENKLRLQQALTHRDMQDMMGAPKTSHFDGQKVQNECAVQVTGDDWKQR